MKAKTAVEWLWNEIDNIIPYQDINTAQQFNGLLEQAMEMEKDQIEEAFELGQLNENSYQHTGRRIHKDKKEYYEKSYSNSKLCHYSGLPSVNSYEGNDKTFKQKSKWTKVNKISQ
jgi:hypothetical protein